MSRSEWEAQRRLRLSRPAFVTVTLDQLSAAVEGEMASVGFVQTYESDTFGDEVTKSLILIREEGAWKILEERAEAP